MSPQAGRGSAVFGRRSQSHPWGSSGFIYCNPSSTRTPRLDRLFPQSQLQKGLDTRTSFPSFSQGEGKVYSCLFGSGSFWAQQELLCPKPPQQGILLAAPTQEQLPKGSWEQKNALSAVIFLQKSNGISGKAASPLQVWGEEPPKEGSWLRDICHQIASWHSNFKTSCCGTNSLGNVSLDDYSRFPKSYTVPLCAMMAQEMFNCLDFHAHRSFMDQIKHKWFHFGLNQVLLNKKQLSQADPEQLQPGCSSAP